jgi:hypothetical protein
MHPPPVQSRSVPRYKLQMYPGPRTNKICKQKVLFFAFFLILYLGTELTNLSYENMVIYRNKMNVGAVVISYAYSHLEFNI